MFIKKKLKCETRYCMCNINGYCVHHKCPKTNKGYKNPEQIANEVEKQMQDQLRTEKELKNLKNK